MNQSNYDFRQFQQELAALDRKSDAQKVEAGASEPDSKESRMRQARAEFLDLRKRYKLTVAHVIAFFPEEEGVTYLQKLIAEQEGGRKRRTRAAKTTIE